MKRIQTHRRSCLFLFQCLAAIAIIFLISSTCLAQTAPAAGTAGGPQIQQLLKNPELLTELGTLTQRLQHELQYPPPRSGSRLLPLLPGATESYAAFPNYGDVARQALQIFQDELEKSPALRDWWQHGPLQAAGGPVLDSLAKFSQLSQYLGDEIVVSGAMESSHSHFLVVAEVRKPGLKNALQQILNAPGSKTLGHVQVLDPQELAGAHPNPAGQQLVVLVRPDYVVASMDLDTLRSFSAQLDRGTREFGSTAFGQRITLAYKDGVTVLEAADLQRLLTQIPFGSQKKQRIFQSTGFADMKYLVWEHRASAGQPVSQAELSFTGPRHGIASWLAAPAPLGSLDFLSPDAAFAGAVQLKNPAAMFDDVQAIADASNPGTFAALEMMEQGFHLDLKNDLLAHLGGEIGYQVDITDMRAPKWRVVLRVSDPGELQKTLTTLLTMGHAVSEQSEEGGITYYKVRIPAPGKQTEINYAFVDGYLILSGNHEGVAEAIRAHRSGESLGKSKRFLAALPPGHPSGISAVLYEDPIALAARSLQQLGPQIAGPLAQLTGTGSPLLFCVYGEDSAIHEASNSVAFDAGAALIVAAVAIPNLLRSKTAANEASAISTIRSISVAQGIYSGRYPERGFAPDLASLGSVSSGTVTYTADHAGLLDATFVNSSCTAGVWCTNSGYRFAVKAVCLQQVCADYVVVATPVSNTGERSFCATSNGVIRAQAGPPLTAPLSVAECRAWRPLQ